MQKTFEHAFSNKHLSIIKWITWHIITHENFNKYHVTFYYFIKIYMYVRTMNERLYIEREQIYTDVSK